MNRNGRMLENLRLLTGVNDNGKDELLLRLLCNAEDLILDYIGRDILPGRLESLNVQIALLAYNRMGSEGSTNYKEGNLSYNLLDGLPQELKERLKAYPRKVRVIRDNKVKEEE